MLHAYKSLDIVDPQKSMPCSTGNRCGCQSQRHSEAWLPDIRRALRRNGANASLYVRRYRQRDTPRGLKRAGRAAPHTIQYHLALWSAPTLLQFRDTVWELSERASQLVNLCLYIGESCLHAKNTILGIQTRQEELRAGHSGLGDVGYPVARE